MCVCEREREKERERERERERKRERAINKIEFLIGIYENTCWRIYTRIRSDQVSNDLETQNL